LQAEFHNLYILSLLSFIGLLSYYIIFSRIKKASFDYEKSFFDEPISIIICAKNELENIKTFFPYWINQKYRNFELIIVNDESTDGSYEYLTKLEKKQKNLKVVNVDRRLEKNIDLLELKGKRYALRKGVLNAINDFVLFTDADCKPLSDQWATEMVKAFSNPGIEIVLGYSPYYKEKGVLNYLIRFETFITALHYFGFANIGLPYMGVGRNIAYKKSLLIEDVFVKSNYSISGDDDLIVQQLANKNNTAYTLINESITYSVAKKTFKSWIKQKQRHLGAGVFYSTKMKIVLNLFPIFFLILIIFIVFEKIYFLPFLIFNIFVLKRLNKIFRFNSKH